VDGHEYSWEEFGSFLSPFTGFNFRLACFDACEEPETTPDPPRLILSRGWRKRRGPRARINITTWHAVMMIDRGVRPSFDPECPNVTGG
jgi:hypothetical protein